MGYTSRGQYSLNFFSNRILTLLKSRQSFSIVIDDVDLVYVKDARNGLHQYALYPEEILFIIAKTLLKVAERGTISPQYKKYYILDSFELIKALLKINPELKTICLYFLTCLNHFYNTENENVFRTSLLSSVLSYPEDISRKYNDIIESRGLYNTIFPMYLSAIIDSIRKLAEAEATPVAISQNLTELEGLEEDKVVPKLNLIINSTPLDAQLNCQVLRYCYAQIPLQLTKPDSSIIVLAEMVKNNLDLAKSRTNNLALISVVLHLYSIFQYLFQNQDGADKVLRAKDFMQILFCMKSGLIQEISELTEYMALTNKLHHFDGGRSKRYHESRSQLLSFLWPNGDKTHLGLAANIFIEFLYESRKINAKGFASKLLADNIMLIDRIEKIAMKDKSSHDYSSAMQALLKPVSVGTGLFAVSIPTAVTPSGPVQISPPASESFFSFSRFLRWAKTPNPKTSTNEDLERQEDLRL